MKKYIVLVFFIFWGSSVFSLDFSAFYYGGIRITDNKLYYIAFNNNDENEEYDITWEKINNVEYITFNYTGEFLNRQNKTVSKGRKRYLIIYGSPHKGYEHLFNLYDENNELVYSQISKFAANYLATEHTSISVTSELTEGNITYASGNLMDYSKLLPWADGSSGSGVGEQIFIEYNGWTNHAGIFGICISNGFVDYNRPYLYEHNNRVKKIRVYFDDQGDYMDIDVEDTPHIQYLHFARYARKIQVEILEVYNGERWNDTCINNILPFASYYSF